MWLLYSYETFLSQYLKYSNVAPLRVLMLNLNKQLELFLGQSSFIIYVVGAFLSIFFLFNFIFMKIKEGEECIIEKLIF